MAIRKQQQLTVTKLRARSVANFKSNPFAFPIDAGRVLNAVPFKDTITRMPAAPVFHNSASSSRVWKLYEFKFVRDSAPETQLIIFKADGKIYRRVDGEEEEIFPGKTSLSILAAKPSVVSIANRLHVTDGVQYLIWDGWDWFAGGLTAPAAPAVALVAGALTGTYLVSVTAVHIRGGVRIHESARSSTTSSSPAAQNIRVTKPTLDTRATHWSVYISEITGAGNRMRRAATVAITSATTDIAANPASTSPFAPERNDKPQASRVLFQWKNRLGMGDRTAPENFWFTAFEEVKAGLNGAPEESVPGRDSTSISDLVNNWRLPDRGEGLRAGIWHENFAFLFSDRNGYVVQGEGGLLDGRALRDFFPLHTFPFGAAGPGAVCSTPHGLVILTPDRKLYLWEGGGDVVDIGVDIQDSLDTISDSDLFDIELGYWPGNSRDWLILTGLTQDVLTWIFDFTQSGENFKGVWFSFADISSPVTTALCVYRPSDRPYLLFGCSDGAVRQFDTECQPAHLPFSLGSTYLGSSVQTSPTTLVLLYNANPQQDRSSDIKYLLIKHRLRTSNEANAILGANPTVQFNYDLVVPEASSGPISITLGSRLSDQSQRGWFGPSGGSKVGLRAKEITLRLTWAGVDTLLDGSGRSTFANAEILTLGIAWKPLSVLEQ